MSRKMRKKQGRGRRRERAAIPAKFKVADAVRVKPGTTDPDFPDIPLGGWAGIILEVDEESKPPLYLIEWNQATLDQMHPVYRNRCERDGLEDECMWMDDNELEPDSGNPVVVEQPTNLVSRPLSALSGDDRVRAIFGLTSDDPLPRATPENIRRYSRHLATHLSFPFKAWFTPESGPAELNQSPVTVVKLLEDECDEEDGVVCEVEQHGEQFELPLADLEVRGKQRPLIDDYRDWLGHCTLNALLFSADVPAPPIDGDAEQPTPGSVLKLFVKFAMFGVGYGIVLGSLLGAVEGTVIGACVGAAVLAVLGLWGGTQYGKEAGVGNGVPAGSVLGGLFGVIGGGLTGAILGAMVTAFIGTSTGLIVGLLLGRLLAKWSVKRISPFGGAVFGAGIGAVTLACYRDQEAALQWAAHGAWIGGVSAVLFLVASVGFLALFAPTSEGEAR